MSITPREQEIRNLPRQDHNASDVEYLLGLLDAERAKVARVEAVARSAPVVRTAGQAILMAGQRLLTSRQVLAVLTDQRDPA